MNFRAITDNNRRLSVNWDRINQYCAQWPPGTPLEFSLTRRKKKRSGPMRRLYFGHVLPTYADHLGYDADEHMLLHRQLKIVWHKVQPDKKGIYRNVPGVFADDAPTLVQDKKRFLEWVVRCAARDGSYIDLPGESK